MSVEKKKSEFEELKKRFDERYDIYKSTGDFEIAIDGKIQHAVNKIMECL